MIDLTSRNEPAKDRVSIRRPPNHRGLETLAAHYVRQSFKPHAHDEFVIGIIEVGAHAVWCRGEQHRVGGGTVVTMHPGEVHHGGAAVAEGWVQRMLYVSEDLMSQLIREATDRPRVKPDFKTTFHLRPDLATCFSHFHQVLHFSTLTLARDVALDAIIRLLVEIICPTFNAEGGARPPDGRIASAVEFLEAHACDNVTIDDLCAVSGLRRRQTIEAFKRCTGLPPHAYHVVLKVKAVKAMLRAGLSAAEAAAQAGFADQSHMTRHFVSIVGMTPGAYAQG
ncbi:transcriptional regulator, AraC family [Methylobacterium sp. 4-46]|uniref:AraC family transcriptional regulator n=1 Tax=unclassified Methylobacterium TaxID=2615210 RepID=UPI000165CD6A|nr:MULTISPECIES: AraC family transcriptional regulator [Methylobacterium]ACA20398.1 transcriptional regulator, AraC family [Methylobacterium sp. 4-46]WFT79567.1 AraC family transcriptional regulator [Methylobacterium nodulans]